MVFWNCSFLIVHGRYTIHFELNLSVFIENKRMSHSTLLSLLGQPFVPVMNLESNKQCNADRSHRNKILIAFRIKALNIL
jgi:hypothetical protein